MRKEVLKRITPTATELDQQKVAFEKIKKRFELFLPENVEVCIVGSAARNTNLRGKSDVDVFLLFPTTIPRAELEEKGLRYAKRAVRPNKWQVWYAEHPYLRSNMYGYEVDIVPAYKITKIGERMTAVDRTPLHTEYLKKKLTEKQKEDVRLLKQFLKSGGLYGAELKIEGFSGYLCELLILAYGSFEDLLKDASVWKPQKIIDIEKHGKKTFNEPLVVIDPVDANRNVASAVSETSFARFILLARNYLKNPMIDLFFPTKELKSKKELKKEVNELINNHKMKMLCILFKCPKIVEDLLWPQMKKTAKGVVGILERNGYSVFDYAYWSDNKTKCAIIIDLNNDTLPKVKKIEGPQVYDFVNSEKFIEAHKNKIGWVMDGRVYSLADRQYTSAKELLKAAFAGKECLKVGADIENKIKKAQIITNEKEIVKKIPLDVLYNFLKKKELPVLTGGENEGRKVLTGGVFDILHSGHIKFLEKCKSFGEKLIVVIANDKTAKERKRKPINSAKKRAEIIKKLKMVDEVIIGGEDWIETVKKVKPDIIIVGYDQKIDEKTMESEIMQRTGEMIPVYRLKEKYGKEKTSKIIEKIKGYKS